MATLCRNLISPSLKWGIVQVNSRFVVHLEVSSSSRVTTRTVCTCLVEGKLQTVFCAEKSCGSIPAGCCLTSSSHQGWANLPCKMNPALLSLGPLFITQQQMAKRAHVRSLAHIQRHSHCCPLRSKPRLHSQLFSIFPLPLFTHLSPLCSHPNSANFKVVAI